MVEKKTTKKATVKKAEKKSKTTEKPIVAKKSSEKKSEKITKSKAVTKEIKTSEKTSAKSVEKQLETKDTSFDFKLFDIWDTSGVVVPDMSLRDYINLKPRLVPFTAGRNIKKQFWKSKKPIVERLILRLMVSGHRGKKHWRMSRWFTGKYLTISKQVIETFKLIEKRTNKNPVQVFVDALCFSSPHEGITTVEYGGVRYPKAVDLSPQRRIDLVLRWMTQGAYSKKSTTKSSKPISFFLAEEILAAAQKDSRSNAMSKKNELERQASASR